MLSYKIYLLQNKFFRYIEIAWVFSTVMGLILFLIEIGLLCWIRFLYPSRNAAITTTILLIFIGIVFIFFVVQFYFKLVNHQFSNVERDVNDLEAQMAHLHDQTVHENHSVGRQPALLNV